MCCFLKMEQGFNKCDGCLAKFRTPAVPDPLGITPVFDKTNPLQSRKMAGRTGLAFS